MIVAIIAGVLVMVFISSVMLSELNLESKMSTCEDIEELFYTYNKSSDLLFKLEMAMYKSNEQSVEMYCWNNYKTKLIKDIVERYL